MNLAIELQQIQRPSWMAEYDQARATTVTARIELGKLKREAVLKAIQAIGRCDIGALMDYTGFTRQSIAYCADRLHQSGEIRKIVTSNKRVFWESIK